MKQGEKITDFKLLHITSKAFSNESFIPSKYTCDGINISPPLDIASIPEEAKSLALIVVDPDAPIAPWVHWIIWNIPVTHHLKENNVKGVEGTNDFQQAKYGGPCPPSGTHRYFFKLYALDTILDLPPGVKKFVLEKAMSNHIVAYGELMGLYKRIEK